MKLNEPLDTPLLKAVHEAVQKRKFLKIQYVTDINEYLTVTTLVKKLENRDGKVLLELANGEEIDFEQLVKVGDIASNKFNARDFTCDC